ncbi:hypothetical protein PspLS_02419 [Pyricularia sp. CBS 133598]|nr:hypothetical protein PspLS_02419 [Pyricularia sp. CBS 133598]
MDPRQKTRQCSVARRTPPCGLRASASNGSRTLHKERCDMIRMQEKKVSWCALFFSSSSSHAADHQEVACLPMD